MDLQMPYLTETKLKQEELEKMIFLVSLYATSLGKNGVPATFKDLLKDMNEAKRMWTQLAKNLKKLK